MRIEPRGARHRLLAATRALLLISAMLATIGCGTDTEEALAEAIRECSESSGIQMRLPADPLVGGTPTWSFEANPCRSDTDALSAANMVLTELGKYKAGVLADAGVSSIILVSDLMSSEGDSKGGLAHWDEGAIYLDCELAPPHALHHEIFHMLDYADDWTTLDLMWETLNPEGFRYAEGSAAREAGREEPTPGFLTAYSMTSMGDDRAEIFAALVLTPHMVSARASGDRALQRKANIIRPMVEQYLR